MQNMDKGRRDWIEACISKLCEINELGTSGQFSAADFPRFSDSGKATDLLSDYSDLLLLHDTGIELSSLDSGEGEILLTPLAAGGFGLSVATGLENNPEECIAAFIKPMISVKLAESGIELPADKSREDFLQTAMVFYGFGVIALKSSAHRLPSLSKEDIAYILTLNSLRKNDFFPSWLKDIPEPISKLFSQSMEETLEHFSEEEEEIQPEMEAFVTAEELFSQGDYRAAIDTMSEFVKQAGSEPIAADAYNNMGFYSVSILDWDAAEYYFEKALSIDPGFVLVYDNLAWSQILANNLPGAEKNLKKAASVKEKDISIHNRNMAVWFLLKGNMKQALQHFELAYEEENPVQLLDYFYSRYLRKMGEEEAARDIFEEIMPYENPELIEYLETWDI